MKTTYASLRTKTIRLLGVDPAKYTMKKIPVCICGNPLIISVFPKVQGVCPRCNKKYNVKDFKFEGYEKEESVWKNLE